MVTVAFGWLGYFFVIWSIGGLTAKLFSSLSQSVTNLRDRVVVGIVVTVCLLQVLSFFTAIDGLVLGGFFLVSLLALPMNWRTLREEQPKKFDRNSLLVLIPFVLIAAFLCYSSSLQSENYDTDLYHYNTVKWMSQYPVIPGLTNIHYRLGFNSSFHLFASLFDNWIFVDRVDRITNGFLFLVFIASMLGYLWQRPKHYVLCLGLLIAAFTHIFTISVNSLQSDTSVALVGAQLFCYLVLERERKLPLALALAGLGVAFKLSGIFILGVLSLIIGYRILVKQNKLSEFKFAIPLTALVVGTWVGRNIILSGYMFFPSPIDILPDFAWKVDFTHNLAKLESIRSWVHGFDSHSDILAYIGKEFFQYDRILSFGVIVAAFFVYRKKPKWWLMPLILAASTYVISYFSVPSSRFFLASIWAFFCICYALAYDMVPQRSLKIMVLALVCAHSFRVVYYRNPLADPKFRFKAPLVGLTPAISKSQIAKTNVGPDYVNSFWIPKGGSELCGNSPIPCFPFRQSPELLTPGDLSGGFKYSKNMY